MPNLTDIITEAVAGAAQPDETGGGPEPGVGTDAGAEPVVDAGAAHAAPAGATHPAAATPEQKAAAAEAAEFAKELEAIGLKPSTDSRENRLPHSRVVKLVQNAQKRTAEKLEAAHKAALSERETKLTAAEARLKDVDNIDHLIQTDPERYLSMLAVLHPHYRQFVGRPTSTEPAKAEPAATDPPPPPDAEYADGSKGYSPEGVDKLLEWKARQVEARVLAKVDEAYTKRFGPLENAWKTQQALAAKLPLVREQIQRAKKTWGALFEKHETELLAYLEAHQEIPFDTAVADVLVPKTQAERTSMREEILADLDKRPRAALTASPAVVVASAQTSDTPRSIEDIIRESIAGLS